MEITSLKAMSIPDLWFQSIYNILDVGEKYTIDKGSFRGETRLEFDFFVGHIKNPLSDGLLPKIPSNLGIPDPVSQKYLNEYAPYFLLGYKKENEAYTYGQRLNNVTNHKEQNDSVYLNQIAEVIKKYKQYGHKNNQLILQVAQPQDLELEDPPCLRHIDTKITNNKLHFFPYFRSWDLWSGLPANLAGIAMVQDYMASEIGVDVGEMIVSSKGLHIYGYCEELAKIRTGKIIK